MKKFLTQLFAIAAAFGLEANLKGKALTEDEQAKLKKEYDAKYGDGSFEKDMADYEASIAKEKESFIYAQIAEALGKESLKEQSAEAIVNAIKELKAEIKALGSKAEADNQPHVAVVELGVHTKDYAFGVKNDIFAAGKRHNAIAINGAIPQEEASEDEKATLRKDFGAYASSLAKRFQALTKSGKINTLASGVDFSKLSNIDLNERYYEVRQDMLISRIVALPSLAGIFPTVSRVQSGQIFTNLIAKAVSQAYQAGRVFKGGVTFEPEKAFTDKVMAKVQFEDMSDLETSYLNYLNTNGSDPMKLSMIEWIILELATQLNNERNERSVMGYRVEPTVGVAGHENFAATGIVYRLLGFYYKEHKVLPFTDATLASYDATDMGEVLQAFAAELQKAYKRPKDLIVYLNEAHKPMFNAWLNATYGKNTGFVPAPDTIPNYGYRIKWVPNMPLNFYFIFATVENNLFLLENIPGEQFDMKFQRDLEEVIVFSYSKEGAAAAFAGVAEDDLAALKAAGVKGRQIIFMNLPAVVLDADEDEPDAEAGRIFITGANTTGSGAGGADVPVAISDIANAEEGVIYHIECGSTTNATTIAKSGKFAGISKAWQPTAVGQWIDLYYDATNDAFLEAARG